MGEKGICPQETNKWGELLCILLGNLQVIKPTSFLWKRDSLSYCSSYSEIMSNGNELPTRTLFLEISDENRKSLSSGLIEGGDPHKWSIQKQTQSTQ